MHRQTFYCSRETASFPVQRLPSKSHTHAQIYLVQAQLFTDLVRKFICFSFYCNSLRK